MCGTPKCVVICHSRPRTLLAVSSPTWLGGRFGDTYSGFLALPSPLSPPTVLPELPGSPPGSHPWVAQCRQESAAGDLAEVTNILSATACLWELARALQTDESRKAVVSPDPSRRHNLAPPGGSSLCSRECDQQTCSLCGRLFTSAPSQPGPESAVGGSAAYVMRRISLPSADVSKALGSPKAQPHKGRVFWARGPGACVAGTSCLVAVDSALRTFCLQLV